MNEELNSNSHYNYIFDSTLRAYLFQTAYGIEYRVAFVKDESLNTVTNTEDFQNIFQLVIEKVGDRKERFDPKVSQTVEQLLMEFFETTDRAVLYFCSQEQNKESIRARTFDRWYQKSTFRIEIEKVDLVIEYAVQGKPQKVYSSLLFHYCHPEREKLRQVFQHMGEAVAKQN